MLQRALANYAELSLPVKVKPRTRRNFVPWMLEEDARCDCSDLRPCTAKQATHVPCTASCPHHTPDDVAKRLHDAVTIVLGIPAATWTSRRY